MLHPPPSLIEAYTLLIQEVPQDATGWLGMSGADCHGIGAGLVRLAIAFPTHYISRKSVQN